MRRLIACAFLIAFCTLPALAQTAAPQPDPDPAKVALGRDIFDLTTGKQDIQSRLAAVQQAVGQAVAGQAMPQNQAANAQATASAALSGVGQIMQDLMPQLREIYANAFAQRFSLEELQAIKSFYESPAGAKLTADLPDISREAMQIVLPKVMSQMIAQRRANQPPSSAPAPLTPPAQEGGQ